MIDIKSLTEEDIGKWVKNVKYYSEIEIGKIKFWNDKFIFVVYKCAGNWNEFKDYTAVATRPKDLFFSVAEPMTKGEILYKGRDYEGGNEDES